MGDLDKPFIGGTTKRSVLTAAIRAALAGINCPTHGAATKAEPVWHGDDLSVDRRCDDCRRIAKKMIAAGRR